MVTLRVHKGYKTKHLDCYKFPKKNSKLEVPFRKYITHASVNLVFINNQLFINIASKYKQISYAP